MPGARESGGQPGATQVPPLATCDRLDSPTSVRRALRRLAHAAAEARITPRQARALAHILRLLLTSTRRAAKK